MSLTKDETVLQQVEQVANNRQNHDAPRNNLFSYAEGPLRVNSSLLQIGEVLDNITGGVVLCKLEKEFPIVYVSKGFTELTGFTIDDLFNVSHSTLFAMPEENSFGRTIQEQGSKKTEFTFEYKMRRKDGCVFWVMDNARIILTPNNEYYIQSIISDITHYKEVEKALSISQKSYELAMSFSDITMFEYDIITKRITTQHTDFEIFGMPAVIDGGMESVLKSGIVAKRSRNDLRELYQKIDDGEPSAQCTIYANDLSGSERILELQLATVFDEGKPVRAVGVRKDITEAMRLKHEKEFGDALSSELMFAFEANVTHDKVLRYNTDWANELHIEKPISLQAMVSFICETAVGDEFAGKLQSIFAKATIIKAFDEGKRVLKLEYKRCTGKNKDLWLENRINIIKDELSGDINIRTYTTNINSKKVKEQKALKESKHYELMISKSATVYEINVTRNSIAFGNQNWETLFGIKTNSNYSEMIAVFSIKVVHPEDADYFAHAFALGNIKKNYIEGKTEIVYEYRRTNEQNMYIWVRCTMHLFEDPQSGELRGFAYVENINSEKEKELELVYKSQHDLLTGFYNKCFVEEKIGAYLESAEGKRGTHIFYIIDIDYFKHFNDAFGHAFGDAVLSQTAAKISMLFRDDDIIGRIGGDEFIVLMKNVQSERKVQAKANEICDSVREVYSKRGEDYDMSVSIGVAIFNQHGNTYNELYKHSDAALYDAKLKGRDTFSVYSNDMKKPESTVNQEEIKTLIEARDFEKNITEYVFRILYDAEDKAEAIKSVLELLVKHYDLSGVAICENVNDIASQNCTFDWYCEEYANKIHSIKFDCLAVLADYVDRFDQDGIFFLPDIEAADDTMKAILRAYGIKSLVQISFSKSARISGLINFVDCKRIHVPTKNELTEFHNIANVLGVFIIKMRAIEYCETAKETALSITNSINSFANVCDGDSFELLFANSKSKESSPDMKIGEPCYKTLWNKNAPCENCPMLALRANGMDKYSAELYNKEINMWTKVTATWIDWLGNKKACLINSEDVTEYKKKLMLYEQITDMQGKI